jgi:hypothetical protein
MYHLKSKQNKKKIIQLCSFNHHRIGSKRIIIKQLRNRLISNVINPKKQILCICYAALSTGDMIKLNKIVYNSLCKRKLNKVYQSAYEISDHLFLQTGVRKIDYIQTNRNRIW